VPYAFALPLTDFKSARKEEIASSIFSQTNEIPVYIQGVTNTDATLSILVSVDQRKKCETVFTPSGIGKKVSRRCAFDQETILYGPRFSS